MSHQVTLKLICAFPSYENEMVPHPLFGRGVPECRSTVTARVNRMEVWADEAIFVDGGYSMPG